eukprot:Selendium_serpulae@DN5930_c0_g1_i12.p1
MRHRRKMGVPRYLLMCVGILPAVLIHYVVAVKSVPHNADKVSQHGHLRLPIPESPSVTTNTTTHVATSVDSENRRFERSDAPVEEQTDADQLSKQHKKFEILTYICNLFGLVYFLSWTVSIIPVIIQSFLKRSARHVSLDTTLHDVFGYFAYSVFTCGKYHLQNTSNTASGVYIHDVALIYDRGARQKGPSNRCMATCIVVGCVQVFLWSLASSGRLPQHDGLADGKNLNHFNVLSMLGKFLSFCLCPEIESKSGSDQGHRKRSFLSPTTGRKSNATSNFNQRKVSHQAANNLLFHATIGTGLSIGNVFLD